MSKAVENFLFGMGFSIAALVLRFIGSFLVGAHQP